LNMNLVRMPAPFSTSSWPPTDTLSSSLTPPTSAASAAIDVIHKIVKSAKVRIMMSPFAGSERLINARCAHSRSHAHRHHPVLLLAPPHAVDDRRRADRAGGGQGVTKRDGAAQRIHFRGIESKIADHREALRGERLVQFDPVDLVLPDAGGAQHLGDGGD